ncbi:hypothetical protein [Leptolyngbya iicbica]|uniref:Uncharacterized protein n=2 Tax=Cyanophyceae TaxID=3028117 RepID=A0A4Q7E3F2_9CYAN|nr:hypothetical protein [Leptolyngbya sp. LK]RZM77196.1 hypothetical protein DYY88_16235 [Leptolyngbya sp. LK]
MNHQPQNRRHQAARKFVTALDELETVLNSKSRESGAHEATKGDQPSAPSESEMAAHNTEDFDQLLDEAVQDIEHFMAEVDPVQDDA